MSASKPQATPAELPLAGGRQGATMTLRPLLCAELRGPAGWFERPEGPAVTLKALGLLGRTETVRVPIVAFLLEHPSAGLVLVDTGFHGSVADGGKDGARNLGPLRRLTARGLRMRPQQTVVEQLRSLSIDPSEVGLLVMTHMHFDHASALRDFPHATVLVSAPEWAAACAPRAYLNGYVAAQLDPRPSYGTLDLSAAATRSGGPFEHIMDLFDDGALTLAATPGHSAGHLSLIVRLREREALIAGDAIYTMATLRDGARPLRAEDTQAFERSLAQLQAYDREHPDAVIVPGHDMDAWEQLEELYT